MSESDVPEGHDDIDGVEPPAMRLNLLGRAAQWREMTEALRTGRMHHAWLLQGPPGIGKATTAFAFARLLLGGDAAIRRSGNEQIEFDGGQAAVRQIARLSHPGLLHLTRPAAERGPGFKTQVTVDEIRRLNHFFHSTSGGGWRIAIVDPVDDLNRNAANALLKTLEEPPARSIFLLVNHAPGRILPTIRSRCRVLGFDPLPDAVIEQLLVGSLSDTDATLAKEAASAADGRARDAFLMIQNGGLEVERTVSQLFAARDVDWKGVHAMADNLSQRGRDTAWAMALETLGRRLNEDALRSVRAGDMRMADAIAGFWQAEQKRWRDAAAFNLDRKQVMLTFFSHLQDLRDRLSG